MNETPSVMQDFVFGALESDANTLTLNRQRWSGIRHMDAIAPLDPQPDQSVTLSVTVGRDLLITHLVAYFTTDGSLPAGERGTASNGLVVPFQRAETLYQPLYWDYAELWQAQLPGQPDQTHVRYVIEGWYDALPTERSQPAVSWFANELRIDGTSEPMTVYGYHVDRTVPPAWAHEAIVYQIFVDRFAPAVQRWLEPAEMETFMGGTLRGVIEALDYVAALGVTAIWLTPIFAMTSYHGYDTVDYYEIEPRLGSKADLLELVQAAHARGLRVILDFVANHSSDQFGAFQDALNDPASPRRSLYSFADTYQFGYRSFFDNPGMPQFNHDHPEARAFLCNAARYWLTEFDIDGYRLDYAAGPSHDFWSAFGAACKQAKPDSWLFGEVTLGSDLLRTYTGRLDGCLDFGFVRQVRLLCAAPAPLTAISQFAASVMRAQHFFPADFTRPAFIENHDMNRFLWGAGNDTNLLRMATALLLAFGGSPILYYGTEVGLGQPRPKGHYREEARHPMLWGDSQDSALLADFQQLIAFRRAHPALVYGPIRTLGLNDARGLWLAERVHAADRVLVAVNASLRQQRITLPAGAWRATRGPVGTDNTLLLAARSVVFLIPAAN